MTKQTKTATRKKSRRRSLSAFAAGALVLLAARADTPTPQTTLAWGDNLSGALTRASYELKPVLAVFTSPNCPWCVRLKSETLMEKEVQDALAGFVCVSLDTAREPKAVQQYQIRGVPVTMIFSGDGLLQTAAEGFMDKTAFLAFLQTYRKGGGTPSAPELDLWLKTLQSTNVPAVQWPEIMSGLGVKSCRSPLRSALLAHSPVPRSEWVQLLSHTRLAVRLGACEILETLAGSSFGYDPWGDAASNREALKRWSEWGSKSTNETERVFSSLTEEQIAGYIRDLSAADRERSSRAVRMLEEAGETIVPALDAWLTANPSTDAQALRQVREVRYFLLLPDALGTERARTVHWLVFGNQDERLRSLQAVASAGKRAVPVLADFLSDSDPLVREGAVDSLIDAAKGDAYPYLRDLLKTEKDEEVIHAVVRAVGSLKGDKAVELAQPFLQHSNEDLVVAALASLARNKSSAAAAAVKASLKHPQWRVRAAALEALGKLRAKGAEPEVLSCLDDTDPFVRRTAVITLSEISSKKSAKRLESIFFKDDALKGPVVAALVKMDAVIPDSFTGALAGKDSDVLLSVIDGLGDGDNESWRLALPYVRHENSDVSCAAIRVVTKGGGRARDVQKALVDVLRAGVRERVIAVFESYARIASHRSNTFFAELNDDASFEELIKEPAVTSESGSAVTNDLLSDVFSAFAAPAQPAAEKTATPAVSSPSQANLQDVFAAFGGGDSSNSGDSEPAKNAKENPEATTESADLAKAALVYLAPKWDADIRFAAALMLVSMGQEAGISNITELIASRTAEEKIRVAKCAQACQGKRVVPLAVKLLHDSSPDVRQAAIALCLEDKGGDALIGTLSEAVFEPNTALSPSDVMKESSDWYQAIQRASVRKIVGAEIRKVLADRADRRYSDPIRIIALALLEPCWKPDDAALVNRYLSHDNPFVRRVAWHTFGKRCAAAFYEKVRTVAADTSEWVRAVVPAIYGQDETTTWSLYFDVNTAVEGTHRFSSSARNRKRLTRPVVDLLTELCKDTALPVRSAAAMCLFSNREKVDTRLLKDMLDAATDKSWVAYRISSLLEDAPVAWLKELNSSDTLALIDAVIEQTSDREDDKLKQIRTQLVSGAENAGEKRQVVLRKGEQSTSQESKIQTAPEKGDALVSTTARPAQRRVVFFRNPGCRDCERVSEMLKALTSEFSDLAVEERNIRKPDDARYNEALCERFGVEERLHLTAPAVFCGAGSLVKGDITFERLGHLLSRSEALESGWHTVSSTETEQASRNIGEQYAAMGPWVVFGAGLLDGVNPCAFATIIFLISYLQLTRRRPREILAVGGAFVSGVFLAYFILGLGAVEVVVRLSLLRRFGQVLNWVMAAFVAGIAALNVWDGIQCVRGRMGDMVLQLPKTLKGGIQGIVSASSRGHHFVAAAFVAGVAVSVLELACTGQVYAPTLLYILKTGVSRTGAVMYLALYNVAFIVPLLVVFTGAYGGLRSERLIVWLRRHAALVKFATALLFAALFAAFVFGSLVQK